jgi:hypothetical protein
VDDEGEEEERVCEGEADEEGAAAAAAAGAAASAASVRRLVEICVMTPMPIVRPSSRMMKRPNCDRMLNGSMQIGFWDSREGKSENGKERGSGGRKGARMGGRGERGEGGSARRDEQGRSRPQSGSCT